MSDNSNGIPGGAADPNLTRRRVLQSAGGLFAAAAFPTATAAAPAQAAPATRSAEVTGRLARYMVESRDRSLPTAVAREAKHRILDTLGAIVSGAHLKPGEMAIRYVRGQGGVPEASVFTTNIRTSAINAALANGMFGHADETDDFEPDTKGVCVPELALWNHGTPLEVEGAPKTSAPDAMAGTR